MGKKKRQSDHSIHTGGDSSDSNEEKFAKDPGTTCLHANKAIHLSGLRKVVRSDGLQNCQECLKAQKEDINDTNEEEEPILICLKCGHLGCKIKNHAEQHFTNKQSDVHDLALNPLTWTSWCFKCKIEIPANSTKKLLECVEYVRKNYTSKKENKSLTNTNSVSNCTALATDSLLLPTQSNVAIPVAESLLLTPTIPQLCLPKVRGLSNLGNTCFFNAVLQCLGQTPFLLSVLGEMQVPGERFRLPGGEVMIGEEKEMLEPLEGELREWGPLTKTLADTLAEIQSGSHDVYTPRPLLDEVHSKCPQFAGYDQQDSHELLRQLLELVRTEDLKRYQQAILEMLKLQKKCSRSNLTEEMKRKVKAYGRQVNDLVLRPEQVFRGVLVSTLECQECHHTSDHIESFLDLSLPVMADKPVHVRRKSSSEDVSDLSPSQPSKHQLKKERKAERKGKKGKYKKNSTTSGGDTIDEEGKKNSDESDEQDQDQSDADVEDNVEGEGEGEAVGHHDIIESGYSSEKPGNGDSACGSPASETNIHINRDSALASPITNESVLEHEHKPTDQMLDLAIPEHPQLKDNTVVSSPGSQLSMACQPSPLTSSSETNVECRLSPTDPDNYPSLSVDRPTSRMDYTGVLNKSELVMSAKEAADASVSRLEQQLSQMELAEGGASAAAAAVAVEDWSVTLAQRCRETEPSGECTLLSCLNQFTAKELMTGNNKVGCEACTKRINHGKPGKTACTNASKQLLISSPPAVLILHLKRFQVVRCMFKKKSREVKFNTVLDLAPYCSMKCKESPTVKKNQKKLLYSLYGVVEHSGTLYGGHYVAYVKVRAPLAPDDPRWSFLPQRGSTVLANETRDFPTDPGAEGGYPEPPSGKWYYVSDSRASEVKEENVLRSQAYLLFYERIW